jgi:uncharacterized protein (DUF433 family)
LATAEHFQVRPAAGEGVAEIVHQFLDAAAAAEVLAKLGEIVGHGVNAVSNDRPRSNHRRPVMSITFMNSLAVERRGPVVLMGECRAKAAAESRGLAIRDGLRHIPSMKRYIIIDPAVCNGRPVVGGTRITVQTVMEFLAAGDSVEDVLEAYPPLTREQVLACMDWASRLVGNHFAAST